MTPRQKCIIAALALANVVVILALVVLTTRPFDTSLSPLRHPTPTLPQQTCQWQAAQRLAQAGLSGTIALPSGGPLHFEITYPLAPGQTADEAAQSVWAAFDIALALQEQEDCATFTRIEVTILTYNGQLNTQISASVSTADLLSFSAGTLSENEFIERVTYTTSTAKRSRPPSRDLSLEVQPRQKRGQREERRDNLRKYS